MSTLQAAAERLADVLERENVALQRLDLPSATALLDAKRAALNGFELAAKLEAGDERSRPAMRPQALRLQELSLENKKLLERAIIVQQHVMSLLAQAARRSTTNGRYGAGGGYVVHAPSKAFALSARA